MLEAHYLWREPYGPYQMDPGGKFYVYDMLRNVRSEASAMRDKKIIELAQQLATKSALDEEPQFLVWYDPHASRIKFASGDYLMVGDTPPSSLLIRTIVLKGVLNESYC